MRAIPGLVSIWIAAEIFTKAPHALWGEFGAGAGRPHADRRRTSLCRAFGLVGQHYLMPLALGRSARVPLASLCPSAARAAATPARVSCSSHRPERVSVDWGYPPLRAWSRLGVWEAGLVSSKLPAHCAWGRKHRGAPGGPASEAPGHSEPRVPCRGAAPLSLEGSASGLPSTRGQATPSVKAGSSLLSPAFVRSSTPHPLPPSSVCPPFGMASRSHRHGRHRCACPSPLPSVFPSVLLHHLSFFLFFFFLHPHPQLHLTPVHLGAQAVSQLHLLPFSLCFSATRAPSLPLASQSFLPSPLFRGSLLAVSPPFLPAFRPCGMRRCCAVQAGSGAGSDRIVPLRCW